MMKTIQLVLMSALVAAPLGYAQQLESRNAASAPESEMQVTRVSMGGAGGGQVKDDLFAGTEKFAKGASQVTEINLDPKTLGLVKDKDASPSLVHKMRFMVIHTYEYDKPGMYKMEDFDAYRKKLEDGTWSCSIHVREKNESTDICSRSSADHEGSEMVILTAEPKEVTFIHMSGDMSLSDLSKMGGVKNKTKLKSR